MQEELITKKKEIVNKFLKRGILLSSELLNNIKESPNLEDVYQNLLKNMPEEAAIINADLQTLLRKEKEINWTDLEKAKAMEEKGKSTTYSSTVDILTKEKEIKEKTEKYKVVVDFSYQGENRKREVQDFVDYFNNRLTSIEKLLKQRQEITNQISIKHILPKRDKESLSLIGIVTQKDMTKNGNLMLTVEDKTGSIKVLVNKNKPDVFKESLDIVLDEVIGVVGVNGDKIVFANDIIWPDIPTVELKKSQDEVYAAFLSDLHVGSTNFLPEDFEKFLHWINGKLGNDKQKEIASKVKYIFVIGDLVDGVGIYPGQEDELTIPDIYDQYKKCTELLKKIPSHIHLIVCPGNHDAMRVAEPQPPLQKQYCAPLYELPNVTMVSNPALVNIHSSPDFSGFSVLMYHGYSFDYYVAEVDSLRNKGGYDRADLIMKFLLKRRHLAPAHTSTLYIPDVKTDPLVIEKVPDFFVSGHIHKSISANYRNTTLICGSCWQSKTGFQEKVGHHPEPSRVPLVNLQTRDVKILKFGDE